MQKHSASPLAVGAGGRLRQRPCRLETVTVRGARAVTHTQHSLELAAEPVVLSDPTRIIRFLQESLPPFLGPGQASLRVPPPSPSGRRRARAVTAGGPGPAQPRRQVMVGLGRRRYQCRVS